jgi:hypothetical protein
MRYQGIKKIQTDGRDDEQVHSGNFRGVVAQKRPPSLAWWAASLDHVLGNGGLSDFKPELEQFAMDARRAPERIFHAHPPDQRTEVRLDFRPPSPRTGLPTPVIAKASPMPTHQRLGADDRQSL